MYMQIVKTKKELEEVLNRYRNEGLTVAFVPTMGALHQGHLSLLQRAADLADITVCSIFVNPTQFNDPEDLKKYPRPLEQDIALLESVDCDVLFLPEVQEMYGDEEDGGILDLDLGTLDQVLEGRERPGHFRGVTQIVYKLFEAVKPDWAVFGQKDLQQYLVIQYMIDHLQLPVQLIMGETWREADGLAMSSRNVRLSPEGKKHALVLSQILLDTKAALPEWRAGHLSLQQIREKAIQKLEQAEGVRLEYFALCDRDTLLDAGEDTPPEKLVALVAAWVDGIRLIDNMVLN